MPLRTASRPVAAATRVGVQLRASEYIRVKVMPFCGHLFEVVSLE